MLLSEAEAKLRVRYNNNEVAIGPVTGCILQSYWSDSHVKLKFRIMYTMLQTIRQCNQVIKVFVFVKADLFLLTVTLKLRKGKINICSVCSSRFANLERNEESPCSAQG